VFTFHLGILIALKSSKTKLNEGIPMALMEKDLVLTTDEATQYLRISKPTFLKYIHLGRIKAIKAGKGWRVLHSELYRFMKGELLNEMFIDANSNKNET
jgi:excisionase family DNA binding protein